MRTSVFVGLLMIGLTTLSALIPAPGTYASQSRRDSVLVRLRWKTPETVYGTRLSGYFLCATAYHMPKTRCQVSSTSARDSMWLPMDTVPQPVVFNVKALDVTGGVWPFSDPIRVVLPTTRKAVSAPRGLMVVQ